MIKKISFALFLFISVFSIAYYVSSRPQTNGAPPYAVADDPPDLDPSVAFRNWVRPEGPAKVALQVGHWKNSEVPEELKNLLGNTGASGGGKSEWEVNYAIAEQAASILRERGVIVDLLPTTIPPQHWADVFVAIHADGSTDRSASGFKAAHPRRDLTGRAGALLASIESEYEKSTRLPKDPNVSRNMRGYYAFGWWRYHHAIHPMTTAVILETGFLTNAGDRRVIITNSHLSAQGLANGVLSYLESQQLL